MAEELSASETEELLNVLQALCEELRGRAASSGDRTGVVDLDQSAVGRLSRIDAIQQQQMAVEQRRRDDLRLKTVLVSLQAHESGEYGWCKRCGEPIGYPRLKARPESPCCVPCMHALGR